MQSWYMLRLKDADRLEALRNSSTPMRDIRMAYVTGEMTLVRKSQEPLTPEAFGEAVFNIVTGKLQVHDGTGVDERRPSYPCPDCDGHLVLRKKYFKFGNGNVPWFYECMNKDSGCRSKAMAKMDGSLLYTPVDAQTRRARKLTTEQFDRLWQSAPELEDVHTLSDTETRKVENKVRARAYRWLARAMKEAGIEEGNISKMDIPALRIAYRLCRDADLDEVYALEHVVY